MDAARNAASFLYFFAFLELQPVGGAGGFVVLEVDRAPWGRRSEVNIGLG